MSYTDNAPLITAWDNRVQALKDIIATLYDGSSTKVVIEDISEANVLLSPMSVDSLTLDSNEQAPQGVIGQPTLVLTSEEGSEEEGDQEEDHGTDEVTDEVTDEDTDEVTDEVTDDGVDQEQEETAEDSVEENTDEVTEEDENS